MESSSGSACHFEQERRGVGEDKTPDPVGLSTCWMADVLQAVEKQFAGELQLLYLLMGILGFMNKLSYTLSVVAPN